MKGNTRYTARRVFLMTAFAAVLAVFFTGTVFAQELTINADVEGSFRVHEYYSGLNSVDDREFVQDTYAFNLRAPDAAMTFSHSFGGGATTSMDGMAYNGYITGREGVTTSQVGLEEPYCCAVGAGTRFSVTGMEMKTAASPAGIGPLCGVNYEATAPHATGYIKAMYVDRKIGDGLEEQVDSEGNVTGSVTTHGSMVVTHKTALRGDIRKFHFGITNPVFPEGEVPSGQEPGLLDGTLKLCVPDGLSPFFRAAP